MRIFYRSNKLCITTKRTYGHSLVATTTIGIFLFAVFYVNLMFIEIKYIKLAIIVYINDLIRVFFISIVCFLLSINNIVIITIFPRGKESINKLSEINIERTLFSCSTSSASRLSKTYSISLYIFNHWFWRKIS